MQVYNIYVDGSFGHQNQHIGGWSFIVTLNEAVIDSGRGQIVNSNILEGRQVGCECFAVQEALKWARAKNVKINIFFDYIGLKMWINDIWGGKPWKQNKFYTKEYRKFCLENRDLIVDFIKVEAHSGDRFNEMADELAKN